MEMGFPSEGAEENIIQLSSQQCQRISTPCMILVLLLVTGVDAVSTGAPANVVNVSRSPILIYGTGVQQAGDGSGLSEGDRWGCLMLQTLSLPPDKKQEKNIKKITYWFVQDLFFFFFF